jgi:hypothetical protein
VGQVTWADAKGQAGVRFTDVPNNSRRLLKDWILTDLLAATAELNGRRSALTTGTIEDGLMMSSLPFHPIRLSADGSQINSRDADPVRVPWWPTSIRKVTLARFVDTTAVICAVLLFSIIVAELTDFVPSWLVLSCTALILGVAFGLLYVWLCHFMMRATLGRRLADLAASDISEDLSPNACDPS